MNRLSAVLLSSTLLAGAAGCRNENAAAAPADPPPPAVTFVALTPEQVAVTGEWIATLDGNVNAQIRPQVSGYLFAERIAKARSSARARCSSRSIGGRSKPRSPRHGRGSPRAAGAARQDRARPGARQAAGRTAGDCPESAGQRRERARRGAGGGRVGQGSGRDRRAEPRLHPRHVAHRRRGGDRQRADRRSRRPDDAPHDGLAGRSRSRRTSRSASRSTSAIAGQVSDARSGRAKLWQAQRRAHARARRRQHVPADAAPCSPSIARSIPRWARSASARLFPNPGNVLRPGQYGRVRAQTAVRQDALPRAAARGHGAAERLSGARADARQQGQRSARSTLGAAVGNRWIVEKGLKAGRPRRRRRALAVKDGTVVEAAARIAADPRGY